MYLTNRLTWREVDVEVHDVAPLDDARRPGHAVAAKLERASTRGHLPTSATVDVDALQVPGATWGQKA